MTSISRPSYPFPTAMRKPAHIVSRIIIPFPSPNSSVAAYRKLALPVPIVSHRLWKSGRSSAACRWMSVAGSEYRISNIRGVSCARNER
jgi:hypothetical protein